MNKNKTKNNRTRRRLELKKETVVLLTEDLLRNVVGGNGPPTISYPRSNCGDCPDTAP
jgi:hypothetical protein